jgi:hypothetical protein
VLLFDADATAESEGLESLCHCLMAGRLKNIPPAFGIFGWHSDRSQLKEKPHFAH